MLGSEGFLKCEYVLCGWAVEGEAFDFVVTDEVDVGAEARGEGGELAGVVEAIVDATQEEIFECDFAAGLLEVFIAGIEEFFDGGVVGPGNELAAELIVWSVEA